MSDKLPWEDERLLQPDRPVFGLPHFFGGFLLVAVAISIVVAIALLAEPNAYAEKREAQRTRARNLWLAECSKPIDECAISWDKSHTLRNLFYERAK